MDRIKSFCSDIHTATKHYCAIYRIHSELKSLSESTNPMSRYRNSHDDISMYITSQYQRLGYSLPAMFTRKSTKSTIDADAPLFYL